MKADYVLSVLGTIVNVFFFAPQNTWITIFSMSVSERKKQ